MGTRCGRLLAAVAAAVLVGATGACGSDDDAPASPPAQAQENLRPPISAHTDEPGAPVTLTVDGRSAPTRAVATDVEGTLLPPQNVHELGWWVDSSLPGSGQGTVVVTGHVDDVRQGDGFAAVFADLSAGDRVALTTRTGGRVTYRVTRVVGAAKEGTGAGAVPFDELNRQDGPEQLALVTCGGPFVGPPLGYRDNIVVFAEPA